MSSTSMPSQDRGRRRWSSGGSLVGLLCALSLGVLLVVVVASNPFGGGVPARTAHLSPVPGLDYLADSVQHAWSVEVPRPGSLEVTDALGRVTRFMQVRDELRVVTPVGTAEDLIEDVERVEFVPHKMQRLREAAPRELGGVIASEPSSAGAATTLVLADGQELGLALAVDAQVPDGMGAVPGVAEECLDATPDRLELRIARIAGHGREYCHLHAAPPHHVEHMAGESRLELRLHEARAPGDGRPWGAALASFEIDTRDLPAATYNWFDMRTQQPVTPPEVLDTLRPPAWDWWREHPDVVLNVVPDVARIPLDVASWGVAWQPGRAYSVVLAVHGVDRIAFEVGPGSPGPGGDLALLTSQAAGFEPLDVRLERTLSGLRRFTQTERCEMTTGVTARVVLDDGDVVEKTIALLSQELVANPWQGPWSGELPRLTVKE